VNGVTKSPTGLVGRLLGVFFRLLYNQFAWAYDFVAYIVSIGKWKSWIYAVIPDDLASPVLEIGFGPGHLLKKLEKLGLTCVGLDASFNMSLLALNRIKKNYSGNCFVVNGYAQFLPFPVGYFSTIFLTFPAEYVVNPFTWCEISRVLQTGGRCIILPAAWITGPGILDRGAAALFRFTHQVPADSPKLSPDGLKFIQEHGFDVHADFRKLHHSTVLLITAVKST
jgi:ubiquinone/menaquinone biosynthesis C-methylase UbiE